MPSLFLASNSCQFFIFSNAIFKSCFLNNFYSPVVQERDLIFPISSQMLCQFLGSQDKNCMGRQILQFLMLLLFLLLSLSICCWAQCYGAECGVWSALLAVLTPSSYLLGWQRREREDFDVLQALFNHRENIGVLSALLRPKSRTQQFWCSHLLWRKTAPSQSDLGHMWVIL